MSTLAGRLRDENRLLDELHVEDRAVRTSFAVGFNALPPEDANAFALLGLWNGADITPPAVAALLAVAPHSARRSLDALSRAHLVEARPSDRYALHDLLHVYAAERAAQDHSVRQRADAVRRLTTWYLHTTAAAGGHLRPLPLRLDLPPVDRDGPPLTFRDRDAALSWLETERPNLVAATEQAGRAELFELAWKLPVSLLSFFDLRKHWTDWLHTYRIGLDATRRLGDQKGESRILNGLGIAHHDLNRNEEALGYYREALTVRRASGDRLAQTATLGNIGNVLQNLGRNDEAFATYEEAIAISREIGDRTTEANSLNNIAFARAGLAQLPEAAESFQQAAEILGSIGSSASQAVVLGNLGDIRLQLGDQQAAVAILSQALDLHRQFGNVYVEATVLLNLGNALCHNGQTPEGLDHWQQAHALLERIGDPRADSLRARLEALTPQTRAIRNLRN